MGLSGNERTSVYNIGGKIMVYIVVEESMGFGSGGWETGYYIYVIREGRVRKRIETYWLEPVLGVLKFMLKEFDIKYTVRKVSYPPPGADFCKQLIKVLCKESKKEL